MNNENKLNLSSSLLNIQSYHKFEVDSSLLNKNLSCFDLKSSKIIYSSDFKYSIIYSSSFILCIDIDKNQIRSKHYVNKDEKIVNVKPCKDSISYLVHGNDNYYIGIFSLINLEENYTYKQSKEILDFIYVDSDLSEPDKLLLINSQFDIKLISEFKYESNILNIIKQSNFQVKDNFHIVHIEYESEYKCFYIFLNSGIILPIRIVYDHLLCTYNLKYESNSYLKLGFNSIHSKQNSFKSKSNTISTDNSISNLSEKSKANVNLILVKIAPIELILPYVNKYNHENDAQKEENNDESHFSNCNSQLNDDVKDSFKVFIVGFTMCDRNYISLIKLKKETFDLVPFKNCEMTECRSIKDIYISNCYNSKIEMSNKYDRHFIFVLGQSKTNDKYVIIKESIMNCLFDFNINPFSNVIIYDIPIENDCFYSILNANPKNLFFDVKEKGQTKMKKETYSEDDIHYEIIIDNSEELPYIRFDIVIRIIQISLNKNKENYIKDVVYSEQSRQSDKGSEFSSNISIVLSENIYEQVMFMNNLNSLNKEMKLSCLIQLNNKIIQILKKDFPKNEFFLISQDFDEDVEMRSNNQVSINDKKSSVDHYNSQTKMSLIDYYLLFLISKSDNMTSKTVLDYLFLIKIEVIIETCSYYISMIKYNINWNSSQNHKDRHINIKNSHNHENKSDIADNIKKYLSSLNIIIEIICYLIYKIENNLRFINDKEAECDTKTISKLQKTKVYVERIQIAIIAFREISLITQSMKKPTFQSKSFGLFEIISNITKEETSAYIEKFLIDLTFLQSDYPSSFQFFIIIYFHIADMINYEILSNQNEFFSLKNQFSLPLLEEKHFSNIVSLYKKYSSICNIIYNIDKYACFEIDKRNVLLLKKSLLQVINFVTDTQNLNLLCGECDLTSPIGNEYLLFIKRMYFLFVDNGFLNEAVTLLDKSGLSTLVYDLKLDGLLRKNEIIEGVEFIREVISDSKDSKITNENENEEIVKNTVKRQDNNLSFIGSANNYLNSYSNSEIKVKKVNLKMNNSNQNSSNHHINQSNLSMKGKSKDESYEKYYNTLFEHAIKSDNMKILYKYLTKEEEKILINYLNQNKHQKFKVLSNFSINYSNQYDSSASINGKIGLEMMNVKKEIMRNKSISFEDNMKKDENIQYFVEFNK